MKHPIAITISDIHFNLNTLSLAQQSLRAAFKEAIKWQIPLIIAGDLNDSKAIIRAEVANTLISIFKNYLKVKTYILVGNHDLINEKGIGHGLNYLEPYAVIVDQPTWCNNLLLIPYQTDSIKVKQLIEMEKATKETIVIMHQGVKGAWMGDYVQDKSSIDPELLKDYNVISGHYHKHQKVGTITFIGSPYTITYGEAQDGPKGFLMLYSNGSYDRVILPLRKHIIVERTPQNYKDPVDQYKEGDILWMKITGNREELNKIDKKSIKYNNLKLDLLPIPSIINKKDKTHLQDSEILDTLIEEVSELGSRRDKLKNKWRSILNETT